MHWVESEYDAGPVIAQRSVEVLAADTPDTLAERLQAAERQLLVEVLKDLALGVRSLVPLSGSFTACG